MLYSIDQLNSKFMLRCCLKSLTNNDIAIVYGFKLTGSTPVENNIQYKRVIRPRYITLNGSIDDGQFGIIRIGLDRNTLERVAVKILSCNRGYRSFKRELRTLKEVGDHLHVVKLLGEGATDLNTYSLIEYAAGEMEVKHIFKQLLKGIKHLHDKDIIYGVSLFTLRPYLLHNSILGKKQIKSAIKRSI
ncbi:kinase-like domain-containing protein [Syncephalis fuscata]|nr:kinase-like domain-containing protein [Syncephalis fuscata]